MKYLSPYDDEIEQWRNRQEMTDTVNLMSLGIGTTKFYHKIAKELPPIFDRRTASRTIGGLISPRTFANLDAKNEGPKKLYIGSKVGYERDDFMEWLKNHIRAW